MTDRLYLAHPSPRVVTAKVTAREGPWFRLDRSIFHPGSVTMGHAQPADRGEVWLGGDKRWLIDVRERRGDLWHRLEGAVPRVGDDVRCRLDVPRRETVEAAHTALHLVMSAWTRSVGQPPGPARVLGGRRFRFEVPRRAFTPARAAQVLKEAQGLCDARTAITVEHVVAQHAATDAGAQGTGDMAVRVVRVGGSSAWGCEGVFRVRTGDMGRVVLEQASGQGAAMLLRFQVRP